MDIYRIIQRPLITERAQQLKEQKRQLLFRVDANANKPEIKKAVETLFHTKVEQVRTCKYSGKEKRLGVHVGRRSDWKKAIVTIKEGEKLDILGE